MPQEIRVGTYASERPKTYGYMFALPSFLSYWWEGLLQRLELTALLRLPSRPL